MRTVFSDLLERGHDEDFTPIAATDPTDAPCGSAAKIEVMRGRAERGECLYHPCDTKKQIKPRDSRGYTAGIRELSYTISRGKSDDCD